MVLSFANFHEIVDPNQRARMLDEGLEIVPRIWSWKPFSFDSEFYTIHAVQIQPAPIQQPRIPIWVGGGHPNPGPVARALGWDGSCLYKQQGHWMQPEDVQSLREAGGFEIQRKMIERGPLRVD